MFMFMLCCCSEDTVFAGKAELIANSPSPTAETAPSINPSLISFHCCSVCAGDLVTEE